MMQAARKGVEMFSTIGRWKCGAAAALLVCAVGFAPMASAAIQFDFAGAYDVSNWTIYTEGDSSVDTSGAPTSISMTGSDTESFALRVVDFTIPAAAAGMFSFDWEWETTDTGNLGGAQYDPAFYYNNSLIQLTDNNGAFVQSGSISVLVAAGDTIGWRIAAIDDQLGEAYLNISNFSAPIPDDGVVPEPMSVCIWTGLALATGLVVARRRK